MFSSDDDDKDDKDDDKLEIIPNGSNPLLENKYHESNGKAKQSNSKKSQNVESQTNQNLNDIECRSTPDLNDLDCDPYGLEAFQDELSRRRPKPILQEELDDDEKEKEEEEDPSQLQQEEKVEEVQFTGYDMRDAIHNKFGKCFDMDFRPVTSMGGTTLYLNVMPFFLGSKRFRHESEFDYLCHLQAIVDILIKYNRLEYVMKQMEETDKKPRAGTSPLVAVPFRMDLEERDLRDILGY